MELQSEGSIAYNGREIARYSGLLRHVGWADALLAPKGWIVVTFEDSKGMRDFFTGQENFAVDGQGMTPAQLAEQFIPLIHKIYASQADEQYDRGMAGRVR